MKATFRIILFLLLLSILCQCEKDDPVVNIPDDIFLNALIELGVDTNGDGIISPAEAEVIIFLDVSEKGISDMTGIEAFINLEELFCSNNKLTSLDVSHNTALVVFSCESNQLTSLDISKNTNLGILNDLTYPLRLDEMPTLHEVCAWQIPFPPAGFEVDTTGSPNVFFTTDCN